MTDSALELTLETMAAHAQETDPLIAEELAELNKARRTVWLSDLRAMIIQEGFRRYLAWDADLCTKPEAMQKAFNRCKGGTGIVIEGAIGTGKSTMAVHLLLGLALRDVTAMQERGFELPEVESFAYLTRSADLFRALSARYGDAKEHGNMLLGRAKMARYLLVDDVGREEEDGESFAAFQALVDYRYAQEKPVIIATNMAPVEYAPASTDVATGQTVPAGAKAHWCAIISRWHQAASWITLEGDDLRTH